MKDINRPGMITKEEMLRFQEGTNYRSYHILGAHIVRRRTKGVVFRVWAPNALQVSVVGDFNEWSILTHPMARVKDTGIWELFISGLGKDELYKYAVTGSNGEILYKADPCAFYSELRPKSASVICSLEGYTWKDADWQQNKAEPTVQPKPMLIYEVHLGSWRRHEDGSLMNYKEIAGELTEYVLDMGYTHIELMPVMEHPFDGSWGYQITGYYSVTSRFGKPEDFMYLVDLCHQKGIGVILDWVPGHFPKDAHGLAGFDGTALYEHPDPRKGEHKNWGTCVFDYGRPEVISFLISNAVFWLEYYHADGLRVDAVASMLYLDYERSDFTLNKFGGREYLEAAELLKRLNETVSSLYPHTLMIAEDSSQWPRVTGPVSEGGLGFTYKWNMGWMNDTLRYFSMDPVYRSWHHDLLTFSLTYAFAENFILPLSHDETVHGKHSLLDKMPGDYPTKFAGLRTLYAYMAAHPGKKLTFMGGEFGQFIEWKYEDQLDWFLLDYDMHHKMKEFVKALNHFYRNNNCLWENDNGWDGYRWISPDDREISLTAFIRKGLSPGDYMIAVINFTPVPRPDYRLGVAEGEGFVEVFNTYESRFGGLGTVSADVIVPEAVPCHGCGQSVILSVPPLSAVFYRPVNLTN